MEKKANIALAGNPNSGKTTTFNDLTGSNQYVGNWPGVTVEKKEGRYAKDEDIVITDLPGVYSLSPYSPEEVVTREVLLEGDPDVVIDVVDATNLERNLYLASQIMETGIPMVMALNMMDLVEKNGDEINVSLLEEKLGCPVVPVSALRGRGTDSLVSVALEQAKSSANAAFALRFSPETEKAIGEVLGLLPAGIPERSRRWFAIKCLENEQRTLDSLNLPKSVLDRIAVVREDLEDALDDDADSIFTCERYDAIGDVVADCAKRSPRAMTATQKIDRVVTNRFLGLPIFFAVMFLVYFLSVSTIGTLFTDWVNDGVFGDGWLYTGTEQYDAAMEAFDAGELAEEPDPADFGVYVSGLPVVLDDWLTSVGCAPWLQSLLLDGVVAGVGAVLGFIPQMIVLFLLLSMLEGCGYMARVAFVMDRVFRKFGLSGKSFIPMLIASGCGVPAIMATKTIENERDRRMTIMTTTMIPCGAKLPVIALVFGALAGADSEGTWWVAPMFYFMGVAAIIVSGIMLRKTRMFAGEATPFVMELPQYHLPAVRNVLMATGERVGSYVAKAGTIIFLAAIAIWFLMNFGMVDGGFGMLDTEADGYLANSLMAGLGGGIAWLFAPLGFGTWEAAVASVTGLVAKETVVATVGILTSLGLEDGADPSMWVGFANMMNGSSAAIVAFCAFNLLCAPCFAAIGTIRRQMQSGKWTAFALGYMTVFAWAVGFMLYQFVGIAGGEFAFSGWTVAALGVLAAMLFQLFRPMPDFSKAAEGKE